MWQNSKPYLFLLPAITMIFVLFVMGLGEGISQSLGVYSSTDKLHFAYYVQLWSDPNTWSSLKFTFKIAFLSTLSSGILGLILSVVLLRTSDQTPLLFKTLQLPLLLPHFIGAYFIVLLCMQSGFLARIAYLLGFISDPSQFPILVNDHWGLGIILTYIWKETPFIAWMLYPVLKRIQNTWWDAARLSGANRFQYMREIVLPLVFPTWLTSCFIVFAFTFSAFEIPYLLGVSYPQALPVLSYELFTSGDWEKRSLALALSLSIAFITGILGFFTYILGKRIRTQKGVGW
ncbi:sugar ABC transporter permease [Hazenella sp. IB182357]|uniref:Sugar ABC transporter permease n=1 Tax=Polycladospora coralii TaxID=2771432 RepID=A0A926ND38_9BACL|nr:sugar ABC transporter permease [Polycladospora coralii]MBD1373175.1 sugar ABC transporter permease [Polycladospora coralii]MBS7531732.1 sugar ABC transporter permease [Polycladospora coralii]